MIEDGIYTHATLAPGITDLISTRWMPEQRRTTSLTLPAVVYRRISTTSPYDFNGQSGRTLARIECRILATSYAAANTVAEAIRNRFSGFRWSAAAYQNCYSWLEDHGDESGPPISGQEETTRQRVIDLMVWYVETAPTG